MTESEFIVRMDRHIVRMDRHIVRIDRHIAQANEHMARGNELMERNSVLFDEVKEELALNRRDREETRLFMRDILRRHEIVLGGIASEVAAGRQVLLDVHEESKAQRQAIWTLIDELREHGLGGRN